MSNQDVFINLVKVNIVSKSFFTEGLKKMQKTYNVKIIYNFFVYCNFLEKKLMKFKLGVIIINRKYLWR